MSENKGFDSMRDLVRALQQTEYGLRTGSLSADDVGTACDNARELYERLVVIRHKSREDRVHEEAHAATPAKAEGMPKTLEPVKEPSSPAPTVLKAEVIAQAPEQAKEPTPETPAPVAAKPASVPVVVKAEVAQKSPEPVKEPVASAPAPAVVEKASAPVVIKAKVEAPPTVVEPIAEVAVTPSPAPVQDIATAASKETAPPPPQTTAMEATPDKEKDKAKNDGPKSASDYLKDANVTPAPAPEMAAIRAQQVVARSGPAPAPVLVTTVAEKMEKVKVTDLAKAVTVSHKFWFTTELFGGDRGAYENGMSRLNSAKDLAGAKALLENEILPKLKKPAHEEALNAFDELLQRRFE